MVEAVHIGSAADSEQNTTTMEDKLVDRDSLGNLNELCNCFLTLYRQNDNEFILKVTRNYIDRSLSKIARSPGEHSQQRSCL